MSKLRVALSLLPVAMIGFASVLANEVAHARDPSAAGQAIPRPTGVCALEPGPRRAVSGVIDADTLKLDDGAEVRLSGALGPRPPDQTLDLSFWPPAREAHAVLEQLVLGKSVELAFSGRRTDRYGRMMAHVFVDIDGERVWVQARMLATGNARAYVLGDAVACSTELTAHEALARSEALGLWRHAAYQTRGADRTSELMRLRSTYQLVEGEVVSVVQTKTVLLLHFGVDKSHDFTLALKAQQKRQLEAKGLRPEAFTGQRLVVRGWIERRQGPTIDVTDASQIQVLEPDVAVVLAEPEPETRPTRRSRRKVAAQTTDNGVPAPQ